MTGYIGVFYHPEPDKTDDIEEIQHWIEIFRIREEKIDPKWSDYWESKRWRQLYEKRLLELQAVECYAVIDDVENIINVYKTDHTKALIPIKVTGTPDLDNIAIKDWVEKEAYKLGFKISEWS